MPGAGTVPPTPSPHTPYASGKCRSELRTRGIYAYIKVRDKRERVPVAMGECGDRDVRHDRGRP